MRPLVSRSPITPHLTSPAELKARIQAERRGEPFLLYRYDGAAQRIVALPQEQARLTIGSGGESDVTVGWDDQVSALHAELEHVAGEWLVVDDGLSRNGTFVNGERLTGRRRLRDADELRVGHTALVFRHSAEGQRRITAVADKRQVVELSPAQQRVLVALCRPYAAGAAFARPASNAQVAEQLSLSVAAVKTHLRALFHRFEIQELPQNEKRTALVRQAFESGMITANDLRNR